MSNRKTVKDKVVRQAHMPRRGTCKKSEDGLHDPVVYKRDIDIIIDKRKVNWTRQAEGVHVREETTCAGCGKVRWSKSVQIAPDEVPTYIAAGSTPMILERWA